jgi:hypothetical protein
MEFSRSGSAIFSGDREEGGGRIDVPRIVAIKLKPFIAKSKGFFSKTDECSFRP